MYHNLGYFPVLGSTSWYKTIKKAEPIKYLWSSSLGCHYTSVSIPIKQANCCFTRKWHNLPAFIIIIWLQHGSQPGSSSAPEAFPGIAWKHLSACCRPAILNNAVLKESQEPLENSMGVPRVKLRKSKTPPFHLFNDTTMVRKQWQADVFSFSSEVLKSRRSNNYLKPCSQTHRRHRLGLQSLVR